MKNPKHQQPAVYFSRSAYDLFKTETAILANTEVRRSGEALASESSVGYHVLREILISL